MGHTVHDTTFGLQTLDDAQPNDVSHLILAQDIDKLTLEETPRTAKPTSGDSWQTDAHSHCFNSDNSTITATTGTGQVCQCDYARFSSRQIPWHVPPPKHWAGCYNLNQQEPGTVTKSLHEGFHRSPTVSAPPSLRKARAVTSL
jgi:hypothetical protein